MLQAFRGLEFRGVGVAFSCWGLGVVGIQRVDTHSNPSRIAHASSYTCIYLLPTLNPNTWIEGVSILFSTPLPPARGLKILPNSPY